MSVLPPKADIANLARYVRFVPKADERTAAKAAYSITSLACASRLGGTVIPIAFAVGRLMTSSNSVG